MFHTGVVESSPLLVGGLLYLASYASRSSSSILAIDVRTHRVRWSFRVPSKVAGSLALYDGVVYVGSYGNRVYALDAITGDPRWVARIDPGLFGHCRRVASMQLPRSHTDASIWAASTGASMRSSERNLRTAARRNHDRATRNPWGA